jgi:tRNA G10  N-methylase Trm11
MQIGPDGPVLTAKKGTNADLFPDIMRLYVADGADVLDMTYGNGVFWRQIPDDRYNVTKNDIEDGRGSTSHDFRELPSDWDENFDTVILDPPYLYTGGFRTLRDSIDRGYRNRERARSGIHGVAAVHQMYAQAYIEAYRVLKKGGFLIVKCMDQVMSGKQTWMHTEMQRLAEILGFKNKDLFVMVMNGTPTMRHNIQKHARRNHSYFLVLIK